MRRTKEQVRAELQTRMKAHQNQKQIQRKSLLAVSFVLIVCLALVPMLAGLSVGNDEQPIAGTEPSDAVAEGSGETLSHVNESADDTASEMPMILKGSIDLMSGIKPMSVSKKEIDNIFVNAQMKFAVELLKEGIKAKGEEGVLVSPLSAQLCLAMVANGADGHTLAEMEQVLGDGMGMDMLNAYLATYAANLPSTDQTSVDINNAIWVKEGYPVREEFLQTNKSYYQSPVFRAPFDDTTLDDINGWVKENTDGMIEKLFEDLPEEAVMALVNTLLFDGTWETAYEENMVLPGSAFYAYDGTKQNITMMYSDEDTMLHDENAIGFVRPYAGGRYAFAALLPDEDTDVFDYAESLTAERLLSVLQNPHKTEITAGLPKFKFKTELDMKDALINMGMPSIFENEGNFGRINDHPYFKVGAVQQNTAIEVNETGTKAAAATGAIMEDSGVPMSVILDRPFLYMILDTETDLPLFIGVLTNIPA